MEGKRDRRILLLYVWSPRPSITANTGRHLSVCLMLGQRLRRWPNVKPTLRQHTLLLTIRSVA